MSTVAEVQERAAEVARRALPQEVEPSVVASETVDWQGEPSLSVRYVLPDKVFRQDDLGDLLLELTALLQEELIKAGERRFAYVDVISESDAATEAAGE